MRCGQLVDKVNKLGESTVANEHPLWMGNSWWCVLRCDELHEGRADWQRDASAVKEWWAIFVFVDHGLI